MSLDVYLTVNEAVKRGGSDIFVRENGSTREITRAEWDEKFPGAEPCIVDSPDSREVYDANITHNLGTMAEEAGIYYPLWRPDEIGITKAWQLIEPLTIGLGLLKSDPPRFEKHNAPNGWGLYQNFVPFVEKYLLACIANPDAEVRVSR